MEGSGCAAVVAAAAVVHRGDAVSGTAGFHQVVQNLDVAQNGPDHLTVAAQYGPVEAAAVV